MHDPGEPGQRRVGEVVFSDEGFEGAPFPVPAGGGPVGVLGAGGVEGVTAFATALIAFDLTADPTLEEIGRIVHEADPADDRYDAPAATGLDVLIRGLTLTGGSDEPAHPGPPQARSTHIRWWLPMEAEDGVMVGAAPSLGIGVDQGGDQPRGTVVSPACWDG